MNINKDAGPAMAKKKQNGVCALCLRQRELRRSHLLGRAIYQLNRDGDDAPVMMTPKLNTVTPKQIWQHLLCEECEQRFSRYGEALTMQLVQRKMGFPLLERLNVAMPLKVEPNLAAFSGSAIGIDTEQLAYFALSVVWRSGVRKWQTLKSQTTGISLGMFKEPIRQYLLGETPFPTGVAVTVQVCTDIGSRLGTFAPYATIGAPNTGYSLLVRGIWFHVITGDNLPSVFVENCCCVNSAKKVIFKKDCEREMLEASSHIMTTAAVSPKLTTKSD